jgi:UDP-glucuronate decarboxylase
MLTVVTGGAGFIGTHLCKELLKTSDVVVIDNLISSSGKSVDLLKQYAKENNHDFNFIYEDICDVHLDFKFDKMYNLACIASPIKYKEHAIDTLRTCTEGVLNMIYECRKNDAVFIHTSTSEVYGDPLVCPQKETYKGNVNPIGARACYDEGKRCAEAIIINSKVKYAIARLFNTYGPGMQKNDGRVISEFVVRALNNDDLIVHNTGEQKRSFCYIADTVKGLLALNESIPTPINIGNPDEYMSIHQLAEKVIKVTNSSSEISYIRGDSDDPRDRKPDISKAKQFLNWEPTVDLDTGLKHTISWFRSC